MKIKNETITNIEGDSFDNKKTQINSKKLGKLFHLLSNIYKDVPGSIIREYASNCWDANKSAGNENSPIIIRLKKSGVNNLLEFEDFGTGITPEQFDSIFINYLDSTKEDSNESIGGFGIGAKSFFAYPNTKAIYITTFVNNVEYKYIFKKDEDGIPSRDFILSKQTNRSNGTIIQGLIQTKDLQIFLNKITEQTKYLPNIIYDIDREYERSYSINITNSYKIIEADDFIFNDSYINSYLHLSVGNILYYIDFEKIPELKPYQNIPLGIKFKIGELQPTPSREDILYSSEAKELILNRAKQLCNFLVDKFNNSKPTFEFSNILEYFNEKYKEKFILKLSPDIDYILDLYTLPEPYYLNLKKINYSGHYSKHLVKILYNNCHTFYPSLHICSKNYYTSSKIIKTITRSIPSINLIDFYNNKCISDRVINIKNELKKDSNTLKLKAAYLHTKTDSKFIGEIKFLTENKKGFNLKDFVRKLKLSDLPRNEWRKIIQDYIEYENFIIDQVYTKLSAINPSEDFIESFTGKRKIVEGINFKIKILTSYDSRNENQKSIDIKNIINWDRHKKKIILITSNENLYKSFKNNLCFDFRNCSCPIYIIKIAKKNKMMNEKFLNSQKYIINLDEEKEFYKSNFFRKIFTTNYMLEILKAKNINLNVYPVDKIKLIDENLYNNLTAVSKYLRINSNSGSLIFKSIENSRKEYLTEEEHAFNEFFLGLKNYYIDNNYFHEIYFNNFIDLIESLNKLPLLKYLEKAELKDLYKYFRLEGKKIDFKYYTKLEKNERELIKNSLKEINTTIKFKQEKISERFNSYFQKDKIITEINQLKEVKKEFELFI